MDWVLGKLGVSLQLSVFSSLPLQATSESKEVLAAPLDSGEPQALSLGAADLIAPEWKSGNLL